MSSLTSRRNYPVSCRLLSLVHHHRSRRPRCVATRPSPRFLQAQVSHRLVLQWNPLRRFLEIIITICARCEASLVRRPVFTLLILLSAVTSPHLSAPCARLLTRRLRGREHMRMFSLAGHTVVITGTTRAAGTHHILLVQRDCSNASPSDALLALFLLLTSTPLKPT